MKRKIIKQGHNTLTITLPTAWAKKCGINSGDYAEIIEQGRVLRIETENNKEQPNQVTIDISGLSIPMIWRLVSSAYRAGYDEIKIIFENKHIKDIYTAFTYNTLRTLTEGEERTLRPLEAVQALVNRFVGFEIIEQRATYCIIKDLGQTSAKELDNTIRRIFRLLIIMSEGVIMGIEGNKDELNAFHIIDTNLDRFHDFCLRALNKNGYGDFNKTPTMHTLLFVLELIGDEYKRLGMHLLEMKKIDNDVKKYFNATHVMLEKYYDLYYNFSNEKAQEIYALEEEKYILFDKIEKKADHDELELLHHLKKITKYIASLVELRMDLVY
jgi:phosphate uptake regulator